MNLKQLQYYSLIITLFFLCTLIFFLLYYLRRNRTKIDRKKELSDWSLIFQPLQEKISQFSEILDRLNQGIWLIDTNKKVIFENRYFINLSSIIENNFNIKLEILKFLDNEEYSFELLFNFRHYLVTIDYQKSFYFITISDITTLKNLQNESIKQERLVYLGKMSASIAHEFKNSLAAIKGFVVALKKRANNPTTVLSIIDDINEEITFFYNLLQDYLGYAKELKISQDYFNIYELLNFIKNDIFHENTENISINMDSNFIIYGDKDRLKQVFINLIKNGLESGDNAFVRIWIESDENFNKVFIKDSGIGINEENKASLFTPFFTTKEGGTGLGLAICSRIVEAHNGSISFSSVKNEGTIFTIFLKKI